MNSSLTIIVVTGASRGAGKGIALALAKPNTVMYLTGRSEVAGDSPLPGTIFETAELVRQRGALAIPVRLDHADDDAVKAFFDRIANDYGRIDILVNNACAIPQGMVDKKPFWKKSLSQLDIMNVGMRSHYVSSYYAAPLLSRLSEADSPALLVHTSSAGGRCYMHGPAYGGGKAAVDKFANDMAVDFRPYNVACVSLWMGLLRTERTLQLMEREPEKYGGIANMSESPEFPGRVIEALYHDRQIMRKSGRILVAAEEALAYNIVDIDGRQPPSPTAFLGHPAQANPAIVE